MSPSARAAATISLVLIMAGCVGPAEFQEAQTQAPTRDTTPVSNAEIGIPWHVGDYWVQRLYYEDAPDETLRTVDYFVETIETMAGETAFRIVSDEANRTYWVRTTDGALLREQHNAGELTYGQPCQAFFPQKETGTSLDHACLRVGTQASQEAPNESRTYRTTVNATEPVSVPAGDFDAVRLETKDGDQLVLNEFYAESACFPAKVVTSLDGRTVVIDLLQFSCRAGAAS